MRATAIDDGDIAEFSAAYWDLLCGARKGHPAPWRTPTSRGRQRAWRAWRERLKARWPFAWGHGRRPDGWWTFDLPRLAAKAGLTTADLAQMPDAELVHRLDADAAEREVIEAGWRRDIEHALDRFPDDAVSWRKHATEAWDVPGWFFDRKTAAAPAAAAQAPAMTRPAA